MGNINYYDEENKVSGVFFKFSTVGDCIEGTLVGISEKDDTYNPGQKQKIYELKRDDDGTIALIGGRPTIDTQMKSIRLGQKIAIKFEGEKPSKKGNPTKLIQIYAPRDPESNGPLMDNEWLQGQTEANIASENAVYNQPSSEPKVLQDSDGTKVTESEDGEINVEEISFQDDKKEEKPKEEAPAETEVKEEDPNKAAINEIKALAVEKLKVEEDDALRAVMETTGLAVIPNQYEKIKEALKAM